MKPPSLALRLLLCLLLAYAVGQNYSLNSKGLISAVIVLSLVYVLINYVLKWSLSQRLLVQSILIYSLFILFGLLRISFFQDNRGHHALPIWDTKEAHFFVGEIVEGEGRADKYEQLSIRIFEIRDENQKLKVNEKIQLIYKGVKDEHVLKAGDVILFKGKLLSILNSSNPAAFDAEKYWERKGVKYTCFLHPDELKILKQERRLKLWFAEQQKILASYFDAELEPREASIAKALVLGDKSNLEKEVKSTFTAAGAMHVLAVSGLHVGMLLFCLQLIFSKVKLLRKKKLYFVVAIVVLWFYALLTGASPSVLRATTMFSFLVIGKLRGYGFFSMETLLSTALLMLLIAPNYRTDVGFQLSFAAMFAIALFYERIKTVFYFKNNMLQKLWDGIAICFAAQIGTVPLCLYYFHQFPNYFLLTNILLLVLAFACMFSGLLFLLLYAIPILSWVGIFCMKWSFYLLAELMEFVANLPFALTQGIVVDKWELIAMYSLILLLHLVLKVQKLKLFLFTLLGLISTVLLVQLKSYQHRLKNELYLLDAKSPVLLISKNGEHLVVGPKSFDYKKLNYFEESYVRLKGGEMNFLTLENESLQIDGITYKVIDDSVFLTTPNFTQGWRIDEKQAKCLKFDFP